MITAEDLHYFILSLQPREVFAETAREATDRAAVVRQKSQDPKTPPLVRASQRRILAKEYPVVAVHRGKAPFVIALRWALDYVSVEAFEARAEYNGVQWERDKPTYNLGRFDAVFTNLEALREKVVVLDRGHHLWRNLDNRGYVHPIGKHGRENLSIHIRDVRPGRPDLTENGEP